MGRRYGTTAMKYSGYVVCPARSMLPACSPMPWRRTYPLLPRRTTCVYPSCLLLPQLMLIPGAGQGVAAQAPPDDAQLTSEERCQRVTQVESPKWTCEITLLRSRWRGWTSTRAKGFRRRSRVPSRGHGQVRVRRRAGENSGRGGVVQRRAVVVVVAVVGE